MKTLYFDCYCGISGDMTVAAFLDLGVPFKHLQTELEMLNLPQNSYSISTTTTERHGISACLFDVTIYGSQTHRNYAKIDKLIAESSLNKSVKDISRKIFHKLAEAEAVVHGVPIENVHFHEVGALDSIIDIVATAICLDYLDITDIYASPMPLGGGFVNTQHGSLPVPAPATIELMKGLQVHLNSGEGERVTPTGAAIIATVAKTSTEKPTISIENIGSGAGCKDFSDCPNILRLFLGTSESKKEQLVVVECNIDDASPQILGFAMEKLLTAGALDVWFTSIQMKKNRPGAMLSFLSPKTLLELLSTIVLDETTAIGMRHYPVSRSILKRKIESFKTDFGVVNFKTTSDSAGRNRSIPEYEDCRKIAIKQGIPLQQVIQQVMQEKKESP